MSVIMDEIIISVGLDVSMLRKAATMAYDIIKNFVDGFEKHAKDFVAGNLKMTNVLGDLATGLTRVAGAVGLVTLAVGKLAAMTAKSVQETMNLAAILKMPTAEVYKFGKAVESFGGNADEAKRSLVNIRQNLEQMRQNGRYGVPQNPELLKYFDPSAKTYLGLDYKSATEEEVFGRLMDKIKSGALEAQLAWNDFGVSASTAGALVGHSFDELKARMGEFHTITKDEEEATREWTHALAVLSDALYSVSLGFETLAAKAGLPKWLEWLVSPRDVTQADIDALRRQGAPKEYIEQQEERLRQQQQRGSPSSTSSSSTSSSETPYSGTAQPSLQAVRQKYAEELKNKPELKQKLWNLVEAEVGKEDERGKQAFIETLLNRADSRNMTLEQVINDPYDSNTKKGYWPSRTMGMVEGGHASSQESALTGAFSGSNIARYATGNESGDVHSGGAQVRLDLGRGHERFVVENRDVDWAAAMRSHEVNVDGVQIKADALARAESYARAHGNVGLKQFMAEQGVSVDEQWCGDFVASVVKASGGKPPSGYPAAASWLHYGEHVDPKDAQRGDIFVRLNRSRFTGQVGSHVGIVDSTSAGGFVAFGGNQDEPFERRLLSGYEFRRGIPRVPTTAAPTHSTQDNSKVTIGHLNVMPPTGSPAVDQFRLGEPHHAGYEAQDSSAALRLHGFATDPDTTLE